MRNITLNCPRCSTRGRVRIDELDMTFRCKRCGSKFHVDGQGLCVLGDSLKRSMAEFDAGKVKERKPIDPLGPLISALASIPYNFRLVGGTALLLLAAYWVFHIIMNSGLPPLPTSLEDRTDYVVRSLIADDEEQLSRLVAPGTTRSARQWLKRERPAYWGLQIQERSGEVHIDQKVIFQDAKTGAACVVASLFLPPELAGQAIPPKQKQTTPQKPGLNPSTSISKKAGASAKKGSTLQRVATGVDLILFWTLDDNGQWLFNGDKTLQGS